MILDTYADITSTTVPSGTAAILTMGHASVGDEGGCLYVPQPSPTLPWPYAISADGTYWEPIDYSPTVEAFGGVLGNDSAYAAALTATSAYCTAKGSFWRNPYTVKKGSPQFRQRGKSFFGGAADNDGAYWSSAGTGRPNGFTNLDWLGKLALGPLYNGHPGVGGSDTDFSQVTILTDPTATIASMATPYAALTLGAESSNSVTGSTPRALNAFAFNNPPDGQSPTVWAMYAEAHRLKTNAGNTYVGEFEIRDLAGNAATSWTPYTTSGSGAIGFAFGAGAGLPGTAGGGPVTCARYLASNPAQFATGDIVFDGAIGPYGPGGSKPYAKLPYDVSVQWYLANGNLGCQLVSDAFGNMHMISSTGGTMVLSGNVSVGEGGGMVFGSNTGTTYVAGSNVSSFITAVTNGVERLRVNKNGTVTFRPLSSAPTGTLDDGMTYLDSSTSKMRTYVGGSWHDHW